MMITLPTLALTALASPFAGNGDEAVAPTPVTVAQDADAADDKSPKWSGSVLLSLIDTQGNTENLTGAYTGDAKRESEHDRYTIKSWFAYTETDGTISERSIGGSLQYDYLAGEHYYYYGVVGAEADEQSRIDLRYLGGLGVGYTFYDTDEFKYSGEAGLTYIKDEFDTTNQPATIPSDSDSLAATLGYKLAWVIDPDTNFKQNFESYTNVEDAEDVLLRLDSRIETSLTDSMLASAQYILDWDSDANLRRAKRDDHRIVLSLGWSW